MGRRGAQILGIGIGSSALIIVSATPGHFSQPGKNSLSLKQLAGLPKTPWRDLPVTQVRSNR
jgi:hypothetical protein